MYFRTEYQEECSTSYEQECSTSYETTYEQQCSTSYETVCEEAQSSYGGSSGGYGAPSAPKCSQVPKQNCQQVKLCKGCLKDSHTFKTRSPSKLPSRTASKCPNRTASRSKSRCQTPNALRLVIHITTHLKTTMCNIHWNSIQSVSQTN